ncbi:MAG: O-antigen polysaccharide polymerase Wzy [Terriglobia bacterium]
MMLGKITGHGHWGLFLWVLVSLAVVVGFLLMLSNDAALYVALYLTACILLLAIPRKPGQMLALISLLLVLLSIYKAYSSNDIAFLSVGTISLLIGLTPLMKQSERSLEIFSPLWFTLVGFLLYCGISGIWYLGDSVVPTWAVGQALWFATLGFLAFLAGFHLPLGKIAGTRLAPPADSWPSARATRLVVALTIFGVVCFWILVRESGFSTFGDLISNMTEFRQESSSMGLAYFVYALQNAFEIAAFLLLLQVLRGPRIRLFPALKFSAFVFFACVIFLPLAIRGFYLFLAAGCVIIFNYVKRPIKKWEFILAGSLAVVFVVGFSQYRSPNTHWESVQEAVDELKELDFLGPTLARFDAIEKFGLFLQEDNANPFPRSPGTFFIALLLRPIPRSLAPSKPLETGPKLTSLVLPEVFAQSVGYDFTVFAELYFYFSFFGIIIGMMIYGILIRVLQTYYERYSRREGFLLFYCLIFYFPIGILASGFDGGALSGFAISSALCWPVLWYLNKGSVQRRALSAIGPGPSPPPEPRRRRISPRPYENKPLPR